MYARCPRLLPLIALALVSHMAAADTARPVWVYNPSTTHWYCLTEAEPSRAAAETQAAYVGGYLAAITSADENLFIGDNLMVGQATASWLGLREVTTDNTWQWDNGEPFGYVNWNGGEPNGVASLQYGEIYPTAATGTMPK